MQSYTEIASTATLQDSRGLLLNNDKTVMSCHSGTTFPTTNLQVGMLCFRTDQNKLYELKDTTPTWQMISDLNRTPAYLDNPVFTGTPKVGANVIWHAGNDGAGSGLDADYLDGQDSSYYTNIPARLGYNPVNEAGDTMLGRMGIDTGGLVVKFMATPAAPSVSNIGTTGTTTYTYYVVAEDAWGGKTVASAGGSTTTGNAILDATNYNVVSFAWPANATKLYVLKGGTGGTVLHSTITNRAVTSVNDQGQALAAFTAVSRNTTAEGWFDGNVSANDLVSRSDARIKIEVETVADALGLVKGMRGVWYRSIHGGDRRVGVIAQEMQQVLPEVVVGEENEDELLSVAYGNIVAVLIEAVKAQQVQIEALWQMVEVG